jgi:hypothetical integral membrane protein (TIGR02206 family)
VLPWVQEGGRTRQAAISVRFGLHNARVRLFSGEHLVALAVTAAATGALALAGRAWPGRWRPIAARVLALALIADLLAQAVVLIRQGAWRADTDLPLQLCDAATLVAAAALWRPGRARALVELLWFWAFAGTLQALLTPDLVQSFPNFFFWAYFLEHGGVVAAAAFLVAGFGLAPRPGAARRSFLLTLAFAAAVGLVDAVSGSNYMYLREKPAHASLLDYMGPWPWYVLSGAALAAVLFLALDAPWRRRQRRLRTEAAWATLRWGLWLPPYSLRSRRDQAR